MGKVDRTDEEKKFLTQLEVGSTVQRERLQNDTARKANLSLQLIGEKCNPSPEHLAYRGSASVHVYYNETLKQMFFVSQTSPMQGCSEILAIKAIEDLNQTLRTMYGRKRLVKRSGF